MKSQVTGAPGVGEPVATTRSAYACAIVEELGLVRREAQREADEAYADWLSRLCAERFVVYRAAQDRADAAQDDLAALMARLAE